MRILVVNLTKNGTPLRVIWILNDLDSCQCTSNQRETYANFWSCWKIMEDISMNLDISVKFWGTWLVKTQQISNFRKFTKLIRGCLPNFAPCWIFSTISCFTGRKVLCFNHPFQYFSKTKWSKISLYRTHRVGSNLLNKWSST